MLGAILLLFFLALCSASTPSLTPFTATTSEYSSYYGNGDCFQQPSKTDTMLIAPTIADNAKFDFNMCGMCYKVTGPNGKSVVVAVFDSCSPADCPDQWTLNGYQNGPFYALGCSAGHCDVTMQVTECEVQNKNNGKVSLWFDDWNNDYAMGIVPSNILVRVEKLYVNYTAAQSRIDCSSANRSHGELPNFACPGNPDPSALAKITFPYTLTLCSYSGECQSQTFSKEYKNQMVVTNFQFTQGYNGSTIITSSGSTIYVYLYLVVGLFALLF